MSQKAKQLIAQAKANKSKSLNLGNCGLTDLEAEVPELFELTHLEVLYLGSNKITDLTPLSELVNLTQLYLGENQITNLSPLSGLVNLRELSLRQNKFTNLLPLSGLVNLKQLDLNHNEITDLSPLSGLVNLTILTLYYTKTTDLSPLSGLVNLKQLDLGANKITELSPLLELGNLTQLHLHRIKITDLSPLSGLGSLTKLYLSGNQIINLSPLSGLGNLTELNLHNNDIADLSPLSGLGRLKNLDLSSNQITDLTPLLRLENLTVLQLWKNQITDLLPLSKLGNLTELRLWQNQITDLSPLSGLKNLTVLQLWQNQITDLSPLSGLGNLTQLDLRQNQITNLLPLSRLENLTELGLSQNQITDLSPLSDLEKLMILHLIWNQITDLSPLSGLGNLTQLNLDNNKITNLSPLSELVNLTELDLSENQIVDLSPLSELGKLMHLYLDNNQITDLTPLLRLGNLTVLFLWKNQIINLSPLSELGKLTRLYLHQNQITNLSPLSGLVNLAELDLSENQIADLSPLSGLGKLIELNLRNNQLIDLSPLSGLVNLMQLYLHQNQITDLSPLLGLEKLAKLNLSQNQITNLTPLLPLLQRKEKPMQLVLKDGYRTKEGDINVQNNPLQTPPMEIVEQGTEAVLQYFEDLEKYGWGYLYEAKLLIVGEPRAGKTTLRKKLIAPDYRPTTQDEEKETLGVHVHKRWTFDYTEDSAKKFVANIWDFGGQERQYPLHQYFLTEKSVYVLLSDDRKDNASLDKWFSMIRLLAGDLDNKNSILLLVLNQIDRSNAASNFNENKYRQQGFAFTVQELDLLNDSHRLQNLTQAIQKALSCLPHIGDTLPAYCPHVRKALEQLPNDYITYERYEQLCTELHQQQQIYNLNQTAQQKKALDYLRTVGSVIHYANDSDLSSIIILNPHWIIDAIYAVLTCEEVEKEGGQFTEAWLFEYWQKCVKASGENYSISECQHLLRLMKKANFDICYLIKGSENKYLLPLCMPEQLPDDAVFEEKGSLQLLFRYEIMPPGLVARLIVRRSEDIKEQWVCKNAAILFSDTHHCEAKLEEYYLPNDAYRYIRICINGNSAEDKKIYLAKLKETLLEVQKTWFKHLSYEEMIPCNCADCSKEKTPQFILMSKIKKRLNKEKSNVECDSGNDVPILPLLGGTFTLNIDKNIETIEQLVAAFKSGQLGKEVIVNIINVIGENNVIAQSLKESEFNHQSPKHQQPEMKIENVNNYGGQVNFAERIGKIEYHAGSGISKEDFEALKAALLKLTLEQSKQLQQKVETINALPEQERPTRIQELSTFLLETGIAINQNLAASAVWGMLSMMFGT